MIRQALISVSDKTGIVRFAKSLNDLGIKLISTGGTAKFLANANIPVSEVAEYTDFPEILDGRVKTLHPKVHGGILARRELHKHMQALKQYKIQTIDLLIVNLYPFASTVKKENCSLADAIENIDIGGPTMLRAAAKNYNDVTVIVDPDDYLSILNEIQKNRNIVSYATNFKLAKKVFEYTAQYDCDIINYLKSLGDKLNSASSSVYPATLNMSFNKVQDLRYGENPHQNAAFYRDIMTPSSVTSGMISNYKQLQGKELSYNNIVDSDAAWECVKTFNMPACVIIKHENPCGVAIGKDLADAYVKALQTDQISAFGSVIAFNDEINEVTAQVLFEQFIEVLIAPSFSSTAKHILSEKKKMRLLEIKPGLGSNKFDLKRVGGGLIVQSCDSRNMKPKDIQIVTKRHPTQKEMNDLLFAWRVAKYVKSNAIVFCRNGMTLGIGAGQMSRLDSARIASIKAKNSGLTLKGSAVASDAFFPFRDALDVVVEAGATCVIQPGGSVRDVEVIAAADEHNISAVLTGIRHFRH
ncbi:MAG: bifunctional phosphoribosylaminoimidazolecarboxamide formyltransferase/IMP cyclohydrolase [Burkholderia sp.]|nr:bifunctional phosphoribosylaminoimidazolecarboxamide formyltransferase/IMP cyclohydrolase [Burkholderia sp.]